MADGPPPINAAKIPPTPIETLESSGAHQDYLVNLSNAAAGPQTARRCPVELPLAGFRSARSRSRGPPQKIIKKKGKHNGKKEDLLRENGGAGAIVKNRDL